MRWTTLLLLALLLPLVGCSSGDPPPIDVGGWADDQVAAYIATQSDIDPAIVQALLGEIVIEGMSELEVLIVEGAPEAIRQAPAGLQWVYREVEAGRGGELLDLVVTFVDGLVVGTSLAEP